LGSTFARGALGLCCLDKVGLQSLAVIQQNPYRLVHWYIGTMVAELSWYDLIGIENERNKK
jgi:hypothetical protein